MMQSLSAFGRKLWREARWRAPVWMQRSIMLRLSVAIEYAILVFRPYLAAWRLEGQVQDGSLTVTFAVSGRDTKLKSYLASILFAETPAEEEIGKIPLWRLDQLTSGSGNDLTFVGASKYLVRRLPQSALVLPRIANQTLDVSGEWEDVLQRFHKTIHKNDLRLIRKHGYEYALSDRFQDFEMFYNEMHLPLLKARYGSQAHIVARAKALRIFRRGVLFLVTRQGRYVSGELGYVEPHTGVVHARCIGVKNADRKLIKEGATAAARYAIVHWANKQGHKMVDFQGTEPYLKKGMFQNKKRWGAAVSIQGHKRIWMKIHRNTPAISRFLRDNPCIFINEQGDLQGLFFTDEPDNVPPETKAAWDKLCAMPGLKGYLIRTIEDFVDQPAGVSQAIPIGS